jgi:hypothetical protein
VGESASVAYFRVRRWRRHPLPHCGAASHSRKMLSAILPAPHYSRFAGSAAR